MNTADFLVIGGGVIGLNIARVLRRTHPSARVALLEKEPACGLHASGRNSGVIHAGFYYTADSLKARLTRDGNQQLHAYCAERNIPVHRCGKLVVARGPEDLPQLDELLRRGQHNGVPLEPLSAADAKKIEPRVRTYERALFSPTTSTADPAQVLAAMRQDAEQEGVQIHVGVRYLGRHGRDVLTTGGSWSSGYVVNAAGLYADKIAHDFGFSERYRIVPFKGLYLYSAEPPGAFRTNIYPVPDLRNPFLGVHFTVASDGRAKIGPTAIPALWREQYTGWTGWNWGEFAEIVQRNLWLFFRAQFDFRRLAVEEIQKYRRAHLVALAARLAENVRPEHYLKWGRPGIRAQLVDLKSRRLEMDFVLEGDRSSFHVLNAVSPAWTCALSFSEYVCRKLHEFLD
jgi:(S)-2-hydroxyglutarate dehydrogenase